MFIISIVFMFTSICMQAKDLLSEQMVIRGRTDKIYQRYYLIKRLEPSVNLLRNEYVQQYIPFDLFDPTLFRSKKIQVIVDQMNVHHSIIPLVELWDSFCAYQNLYSAVFRNEFIELVYYIYSLFKPTRDLKKDSLTEEQKLCVIDSITDSMMFGQIRRSHKDIENDIAEVDTDLIAKRFFTIKRLNKCISFLSYLNEQEKGLFYGTQRTFDETADLLNEIDHFSHDRVKECIVQICQKKDLEPLIRVCNEFKQYRFAQDDAFLQEMLMNIFLVYKSLLFKNLSEQTEQVIMIEMNQVLEIYENIDSLPLDETLEAIDTVTDKLISVQALENKSTNNRYIMWAVVPCALSVAGMGIYHYLTK